MKKKKVKARAVKPRTTIRKMGSVPDVYTVIDKDGLFYLQNAARKEKDLGPFSTLAKASEFAKSANGKIKSSSKSLGILG